MQRMKWVLTLIAVITVTARTAMEWMCVMANNRRADVRSFGLEEPKNESTTETFDMKTKNNIDITSVRARNYIYYFTARSP